MNTEVTATDPSKPVPVSDYFGKGRLLAEVLLEDHPVFGYCIKLQGIEWHNVVVNKIPFQHLVDTIQVAETSKVLAGEEIPLRDLGGNAWLFISRNEEKVDHQEKKPLITLRLKDLGLGSILNFRQKLLKEFIGEISARLPKAEAA